MCIPLALDLSGQILDYLNEAPGFSAVGKGIGGIMLLIVLIYYLISLLDGGKFQLKMLWPFAIFLIVCNFHWVSEPTVGFLQAINEGLAESVQSKVTNLYAPQDNMATKFFAMAKEDVDNALHDEETAKKVLRFLSGKRGTDDVESGQDGSDIDGGTLDGDQHSETAQKGFLAKMANNFFSGLEDWWDKIKVRFVTSLVGPVEASYTSMKYSFVGLLALALNFICDAMAFVILAFSAVLSGIIIAFGPITFSFAILPGMHRNMGSWFIRLVQFSLWSPIVNLIKYFCAMLFTSVLGGANGAMGCLFLIAMILAELVALVSVPTIASMIVEGASGAVSLSQGLHTIASAATGGTIGGWISGAITKRQTDMLNAEEKKRDDKEMDILQGISDKMGNGGGAYMGGSAGHGIQGQNPMKDARGGSSDTVDGQNSFDNLKDSDFYE